MSGKKIDQLEREISRLTAELECPDVLAKNATLTDALIDARMYMRNIRDRLDNEFRSNKICSKEAHHAWQIAHAVSAEITCVLDGVERNEAQQIEARHRWGEQCVCEQCGLEPKEVGNICYQCSVLKK